jgi:hypothetical protein
MLVKTLFVELQAKFPEKNLDFFGLDVTDSMVLQEGYFMETTKLLSNIDKYKNWANRLILIKSAGYGTDNRPLICFQCHKILDKAWFW